MMAEPSLYYTVRRRCCGTYPAKEHVFEFEAGYAVKSDTFKSGASQYRSLPSETMATLLFRSDSVYSESACLDLAEWIGGMVISFEATSPEEKLMCLYQVSRGLSHRNSITN